MKAAKETIDDKMKVLHHKPQLACTSSLAHGTSLRPRRRATCNTGENYTIYEQVIEQLRFQ